VFSAQLYSCSHETKRLLNELNANGDNVTEPDIITKSEDVSEAVRDLLTHDRRRPMAHHVALRQVSASA
jgi:hypothetical protein